MKLTDLDPQWGQCYARFSPERGGEDPLPKQWLTFRCPVCPKGSIQVYVTTEPFGNGAWHVDALLDYETIKTVTVTPSIGNEGPGRHGANRPPCTAHFSIINGEIKP